MRHDNHRHTTRYTVIGNHLLQHSSLSLTAIGLAAHIQSLPSGASITIKALSSRFPEGEVRIARALRELETHGYLSRTRERLPSGRVVTHTTSHNHPGATTAAAPTTAPADAAQSGTATPCPRATRPAGPAKPVAPTELDDSDPAVALLIGLRHIDSRLTLPARDVARLAPGVTTWFDRNIPPEAVRRTLTADLPTAPLHHPAGLLAHRIEAYLPPPRPARPPLPLDRPGPDARPAPLQNCEGCDRAFRSPAPGRCMSCTNGSRAAA
ncbi:helix-turn-helix domain-containing protein [Streptomyces sp. SID5785]|uniref:helix-turn-helix domain-containing protein n=1 Tax=Streptomyces sp. SID5785 TaxID=2690309 RepID=UPI0031BBA92A